MTGLEILEWINTFAEDGLFSILVVGLFFFVFWKIFQKQTGGFGPSNTSIVLMVLVLFIAAVAVLMEAIDWEELSNILFAVIGFAGGLITARMNSRDKSEDGTSPGSESQPKKGV